ncbi:dirigent protein 23-like [Hibiscus syriacus]|uniref:Dirigent protein n=1 Tax=Hibiscus syriacus TaxID=106335 RepID=A0A6A3CDQ8_HIBSY|nr:dirigent protein 4-like [Hibiscus syriacus]KAE8725568.1 dirigent protein 23-like [Hibiscus syriacus]
MEKLIIIVASAMTFLLAIGPAYGQYYSETVTPPPRREKMTRLHFFFHDILSGKNPGAVPIALPNITNAGLFLTLIAMDDPLTIGPELTSTNIGNAQGIYVWTARDPTMFSAVFYADFAFTSGRFNGSSFGLFSRYPETEIARASEQVIELAVVGGRGAFRMATGYALTRVTYASAENGDASLEFNVTLYHY